MYGWIYGWFMRAKLTCNLIFSLGCHFAGIFHGRWSAMDADALRSLSTARLFLLVFYSIREICRRCHVPIDENGTITLRFNSDTSQPAPGTPESHYLCCHTCESCPQFCCDRDPHHAVHRCHRHRPQWLSVQCLSRCWPSRPGGWPACPSTAFFCCHHPFGYFLPFPSGTCCGVKLATNVQIMFSCLINTGFPKIGIPLNHPFLWDFPL